MNKEAIEEAIEQAKELISAYENFNCQSRIIDNFSNKEIEHIYNDLHKQICDSEHRVFKSSLRLIAILTDAFAGHFKDIGFEIEKNTGLKTNKQE